MKHMDIFYPTMNYSSKGIVDVKPEKNSNYLRKGKIVILVKSSEFL